MSSSHLLAANQNVYEALANRYRVCATSFSLRQSAESYSAVAAVAAARSKARTAVLENGLRSAVEELEELAQALSSAKEDKEACFVRADLAFLAGSSHALPEQDTWLAASLYVCLYLAPSQLAAAKSMLPQIAQLAGHESVTLFWNKPEHEWQVLTPDGAVLVALAPADKRCSRTGCRDFAAKKCAACRRVRYCGARCQRQHWKEVHKKECCA